MILISLAMPLGLPQRIPIFGPKLGLVVLDFFDQTLSYDFMTGQANHMFDIVGSDEKCAATLTPKFVCRCLLAAN